MIDVISWENAHLLGDILPSQHRLRYRVFVERMNWDVPHHNGMEYDQFDTPAAVYLVQRDGRGEARGITRLIPTTRPYMVKELWPDWMEDARLPSSPDIWEASRFGADRCIDAGARRRVVGELVCGCLEYGLAVGIREYVCVMPLQIFDRVLRGSGCVVDLLGKPRKIGGFQVAAGRVHITRDALLTARRRHGISGAILNIPSRVAEAA